MSDKTLPYKYYVVYVASFGSATVTGSIDIERGMPLLNHAEVARTAKAIQEAHPTYTDIVITNWKRYEPDE